MKEAEHSSWVNETRWRDRFELQEALPGGGQGEAYRALRKSDQTPVFVKAIKSPKDPERRARFFREATAYDSFDIAGIPQLIESNAHLHKEPSAQLYIATTFIEGPTIRRWRAETTADLETGVHMVLALLEILDACHANGCIHRDVKPDNIILAGGDPAHPKLLDFGLSYHEVPDLEFQTEHGQEVGNRFLRLPELSAGSLDKKDRRSDVSFAAGILFYVLTGEHPDVLQDAHGRLPHQRSPLHAQLQTIAGRRFARLASIFDSAFAPTLLARFSDARAFADRLRDMMTDPVDGGSPSEDLAAILALTDTEAERRRVSNVQRLGESVQHVRRIFHSLQGKLKSTFELVQTGYNVTAIAGRNTLMFRRTGSDEILLSVPCEVFEAGDELVFALAGETIYRTDLGTPEYKEVFSGAIEAWLLKRLRKALDDPDELPPEADIFMERRPHAHLEEAREAAECAGKRVLAFVYDPTQNARGQLRSKLGYFLQNRQTRDAMNSAFVVALVPLSQVIEISPILNGQSMEGARWVLFEPNNSALEQAVIYANPEEGEKIMNRLAEQYGPQVESSGLGRAPTHVTTPAAK
ncbi:MAG TPA: protein kinase [Acidobacteriaceae bacterium]|nr:protein kinase [Acidobacteriaceae bacterium]